MSWSIIEEKGRSRDPFYLYQPFSREEWDTYPFASESDLEWFRDARFGLFLHVGLAAQGKVDIGWSRHTHKRPDDFNTGAIPDAEYDGWARQLSFEAFDARAWIALAKTCGFRYVVIITKHHDGFHLWDTGLSDHKITNSPFGRDYLRELVDACHDLGMKVGFYFSQRDWYHPDYEPVAEDQSEKLPEPPFHRPLNGQVPVVTERHRRFIRYMHEALGELMTRYGKVDLLWWDASWYGGMFQQAMWDSAAIELQVRQWQPGILINNRNSLPGDFDTPECRVGFFQNHRPWETCTTLGPHWAWTGEALRPLPEVFGEMIQSFCGDGNFLLSIGARPDGRIDGPETEALQALGAWMATFGDSVYRARGGPWFPAFWGGSTFRGNKVWIHWLGKGSELKLPPLSNQVVGVSCLTGEAVQFDDQGPFWVLRRQTEAPAAWETLVELSFEHPVSAPKVDLAKGRSRYEVEIGVYGEPVIVLENRTGTFTLDLAASGRITALSMKKSVGQVEVVEIDPDGAETGVSGENALLTELDIDIKTMVAGAPRCGKPLGAIRIVAHGNTVVHSVTVYAKA